MTNRGDERQSADLGEPLAEGLGIDLLEYLQILRRRWLVMVLTVAVVATGGLVYTIRQPRIYQAQVTLILRAPSIQPLGDGVEDLERGASYYWFNKDYRETQANVITSRPVLEKVASTLQLAADHDFLGLDELPTEALAAGGRAPDPVAILGGVVTVDLKKDSDLATIRVRDRNPARAALIADAVVAGYNQLRRENKLKIISSAGDWLTEQAVELRAKLDKAEGDLLQFQVQHNIQATSFEEYQKLVAQRQATMSEDLLRAKAKQWQAQTELETLTSRAASPESLLNSPLVESNASLRQLSENVRVKEQELIKVAAELQPRHPGYVQAEAQLAGVRAALREELLLLRARAGERAAEAQRLLRQTAAELEAARSEALRLNRISIDYQRLSYEIKNLRTLYALVIKRSKEAEVSGVARFQDVEVVEPALEPRAPVYPRTHVNLLLSLALGALLAVGMAFLLENIDTKISGREEAERLVGRPFLGTITHVDPAARETAERINALGPEQRAQFAALDPRAQVEFFPLFFSKSNVSESIRLVRTNLLFMLADHQHATLLITSAHPREGKSTVVNHLGIALAALGKRVVLVDSDLHKPMLHRTHGLPNERGASSWMLAQAPLDQIVQRTRVPGLEVITSGPLPPNSAELLSSARFEQLVAQLTERYDYVLLDSPPILALSDALVISRLVQGILLVLDPALTDRTALKATVRQLRDINAPLAGFVFNRIESRRGGYYAKGGYYARYGRYYDYHYDRYHEREGAERGEAGAA